VFAVLRESDSLISSDIAGWVRWQIDNPWPRARATITCRYSFREVIVGAMVRRSVAAAGALLLSTAVVATNAASAQAVAQDPGNAVLTGIRTGAHPTFDRIVLDFTRPAPQVSSRFVDELIQDGSGNVEPLDGAVFAEVRTTPAQAHLESGTPSYPGPRKFNTPGLANVTAVALTGDFEGVVTTGIGMRHQAPVSVYTMDDPTRVVIDVRRAPGAAG
jgi:hypothetical protein